MCHTEHDEIDKCQWVMLKCHIYYEIDKSQGIMLYMFRRK